MCIIFLIMRERRSRQGVRQGHPSRNSTPSRPLSGLTQPAIRSYPASSKPSSSLTQPAIESIRALTQPNPSHHQGGIQAAIRHHKLIIRAIIEPQSKPPSDITKPSSSPSPSRHRAATQATIRHHQSHLRPHPMPLAGIIRGI